MELVLPEEGVAIIVEELECSLVPQILVHGDGGVDGLGDGADIRRVGTCRTS